QAERAEVTRAGDAGVLDLQRLLAVEDGLHERVDAGVRLRDPGWPVDGGAEPDTATGSDQEQRDAVSPQELPGRLDGVVQDVLLARRLEQAPAVALKGGIVSERGHERLAGLVQLFQVAHAASRLAIEPGLLAEQGDEDDADAERTRQSSHVPADRVPVG